MVLICDAIVASVPIPCLSISDISSTSVMQFGAHVLPFSITKLVGSNSVPFGRLGNVPAP